MSKIVSGSSKFQAPLLRSTTAFLSRVNGSTHMLRTKGAAGPPPGPSIPEDAVFYAPLQSDLKDLVNDIDGTFSRASTTNYERGGTWFTAAVNQPAFGNTGLVMEKAVTNYCANYNASPETSLTGITPNGATVTAFSSPAEIAAAGLSNLVPGGYVIRMENATGATVSPYIPNSSGAYIFTHSAWVNTFGVNCTYKFQTNGASKTINTSGLQRVFITEEVGANDAMQWDLAPGQIIHVILNQTAQGGCWYNPIITTGATATKAQDILSWDMSGIIPVSSAEGMLSCRAANLFDQPPPGGLRSPVSPTEYISLRPVAGTLIYLRLTRSFPNDAAQTFNSAGSISITVQAVPWTSYGIPAKCIARWGSSNGETSKTDDSGTWYDSGTAALTSPIQTTEQVIVMHRGYADNRYFSHEFSNVTVWNTDKGLAFLKDNS